MEIANLLEAKVEAEKALEMYRGLYNNARSALDQINRQLSENYKGNEQSRYTDAQVREARQGINSVLSGGMKHPWQVVDALPHLDSNLVQRELRKMAKEPRSPVIHNGRQGPASKYGRSMAA